jgi:diguanylate cyclase (GGDEF)-like protein
MKRPILLFLLAFGSALGAGAASQPPHTSLREIHELTAEMVAKSPDVAFEATVTYFFPNQEHMFVQDGEQGIFVSAPSSPFLVPGDRVLIKGEARASFHPLVIASSVTLLHHGALPKPFAATYDQLLQPELDCRLVKVQALVRSADVVTSLDHQRSILHLLSGGGEIYAALKSGDGNALKDLLNSEVEVTAVVGERFDRKMQRTDFELYISSPADIKIVKRPAVSPWSLPETPMDEVFKGYRIFDARQRLHVHGVITLYDPGEAVVLQDGRKSIWITTETRVPMKIGDVADATGFPDLRAGHLMLTTAEILDRNIQAPVAPLWTTSGRLASRANTFDLVDLEGKVVTEARTASRDEYVLESDGLVFSAVYRHPETNGGEPVAAMKRVPVGATVRVTGVCEPEDSGRYDRDRSFNLRMRSNDDIAIIDNPSWVNTRSLFVVVLMLLLVIALGAAFLLRSRKIQQKTQLMAKRIERDASLERLRSSILEDINGSCPLPEVLEEIAGLVSFQLDGAPCWLQVPEELWGSQPLEAHGARVVQREIPGRSGCVLGALYVALDWRGTPTADEVEALSAGAGLASLAIETRKLYQDLVRRSEFDLLTNLHNRFSLDRQLGARIGGSRQTASMFGLIYIDLDKFKEINDLYGHRVGDLYLSEVAQRLSAQLRSVDMLARLGGDEFAALTPEVHHRADVEEIVLRLERCFDAPFHIKGHSLGGSASIGFALYPEDGADRDELFIAADEAMYRVKRCRRQIAKESLTAGGESEDCVESPA